MEKKQKGKIKIAFIKCDGLCAGGTEKFLQTVAALLPKRDFIVDYYYSGNENIDKKRYLIDNGVNLKKFNGKEVVFSKKIKLLNSNFYKNFSYDYDLIQTGRCGIKQEPFSKIKNIPIIDSIHYVSGVCNQYNISRVMHISRFSRDMWIEQGGDAERVVSISHPIVIPKFEYQNIRNLFGLKKDCFIFGLHQRNDDDIFSDIPLKAFKLIENSNNAFVICGGSSLYKKQVETLNLKNVYFIEHTTSSDKLYSFLKSLNVYAHGRKDGELNSTAIAEALYFGLPIITHPSNSFNGHLEIIKDNGFIARTVEEYAKAMKNLQDNEALYQQCSISSKEIFENKYNPDNQIKNIIDIYKDVLKNPYPHKIKRFWLHFGLFVMQRTRSYIILTIFGIKIKFKTAVTIVNTERESNPSI